MEKVGQNKQNKKKKKVTDLLGKAYPFPYCHPKFC